MQNIRRFFWVFLLGITGLWLLADTWWPQPFGYFAFRGVFMQYSGVVAVSAMSISMVLATRPRWAERFFDGLDKMYRLHKWLGITALVASALHWWWAQGTKWMVGWGWLTRPTRGPRPAADASVWTLQQWLGSQRGLAEWLSEWAFYAALVLMVLALVKRFPYRLFAKTHTLLAVAYLVLAYHAVVLVKYSYWSQPVGWLVALLLGAGSVSAMIVLFKLLPAKRPLGGRIEALQYYPALEVLETHIALQPGWPGHAAGQFAFVTTSKAEGAHPYTIASAWNAQQPRITFITKALGDYTRTLHQTLAVGQPVTLEGPYGCFTFDDAQPQQIWVGGGIGITPFVARLKHLAQQGTPQRQTVDLFHSTRELDQQAIDKLTADAAAAGVRLHVLVDARDGRLTPERIRSAVPAWREASLWFCGPAAFGQALRQDWIAQGQPASRFHQELFAMR